MIFKDGKALLGKRRGAHGEGEYGLPGGHLEFGESFEACARRETREEAGIEIGNVRFLYLANLVGYEKHYAQIGIAADWVSGEPRNLEPERNDGWAWYSLDDLPAPLFRTVPWYLEALRTGQTFFDSPPNPAI